MKQVIRADALLAMFGVVCCIGTASYLSPKAAYFLPNALIYLCLQLAVVAIGLLVWPRRAVSGGVAVAMALYLAAFHWWVNLFRDPDGLIWIYPPLCNDSYITTVLYGYFQQNRSGARAAVGS